MRAASDAGGASNLLCPLCSGGTAAERSLSVFQSGTSMVGKCWRSKCGAAGELTGAAKDKGPAKLRLRPYEGDLMELVREETSYLAAEYGITIRTCGEWGLRATSYQERTCIAYPVLGADRRVRGITLRELYKGGTGKVRRLFRSAPGPAQAIYAQQVLGNPRGYVIVEDPLSALRCWQLGYTACCLIGNHFSADRHAELQQIHSGMWMMALDADAFGLTCKYSRDYARIAPIRLERDLKNCTDAEILERLS